MNKLLVDKDSTLTIENNVIDIEILVKKLEINIKGKVMLNEISINDKESIELVINVLENSELIYNKFSKVKNMDDKIVLNIHNKSSVVINHSIIAKDRGILMFDSNIKGSNTKCEINIKGVTIEEGSLEIKATGDVLVNTIDNDFLENIRIMTLNDKENIIIPNLLVSSNEVIVNHNATIGGVDEDSLFYLTSKGLSINSATDLIKKGYLINNLNINKEQKEEIEKYI